MYIVTGNREADLNKLRLENAILRRENDELRGKFIALNGVLQSQNDVLKQEVVELRP
jgi:cell division protein FtsB